MFSNEFILASAILEDIRENGELQPDQIMSLCNINGLSYEAVCEILDDAQSSQNVANTSAFGLRFVAALSVAKVKDDDDEILKRATAAYLQFIDLSQKLIERYGDKGDEMLIGFKDQILKIRNM